jgi:hypothetical protein
MEGLSVAVCGDSIRGRSARNEARLIRAFDCIAGVAGRESFDRLSEYAKSGSISTPTWSTPILPPLPP